MGLHFYEKIYHSCVKRDEKNNENKIITRVGNQMRRTEIKFFFNIDAVIDTRVAYDFLNNRT